MRDYRLKEKIKERNNKWKIVALKRLLITPITDGPHETPTLLDKGIPFLSAESVKDGVINFNKKRGYISENDHKRFSKKCLPQKNDIFVVKSGATTGKVAFVNTEKEFSIWSPLALIRVDKEKVDPYYLYYFISSPAFFTQVETGWNYGTQQNIGMKVMENLSIVVPPLIDQKTIYTFLDQKTTEIDSLIADKEKLIKLLEEKRQAIITEAVAKGLDPNVKMRDSGVEWIGEIPEHWSRARISYATRVRTGGTPSRDIREYWEKGTINWISSGEINKEFIYDSNSKITEIGLANSNANYLPINTVLIALNGQGKTKGKVAILKAESTCNQSLAAFICNERKLHHMYAYYYLKSQYKNIRGLVGDGLRDGLSLKLIKSISTPLPTVKEQEEIAEYLNHFDTVLSDIKAEIQEALSKLKEYRQSLIYEAVTGKIDVQVMMNENEQKEVSSS